MDRIKNIYAYNLIKAPSLKIGNAESELLVRLLDIDGKFTRGEFPVERLADELVTVIEDSQVDFPLDRMCIAFVTPFSQRLQVVSSAHASDMSPNTEMIPGYSCYVAANSSLFKISQSDARVCSDLELVMKSYIADNRPPQRGLGKLHKMGIRSGMTFSLPTGPLGRGFLFLNSRKPGAYRGMESNYLLVASLLRLICTNALSRHFQGLYSLSPRIEAMLQNELEGGSKFDLASFCRSLSDSLSEENQIDVNVVASQTNFDFFYPSATAVFLISEIMSNHYRTFSQGQINLHIEIHPEHHEVKLAVSGPELVKVKDVSYLQSMTTLVNFQMHLCDHSFSISTAFDPLQQADLDYSI
jgi:hypothetical protein